MTRRFGLLFAIALLAVLAIGGHAHAAQDPKLLWKTLTSKHFRITYYSTEDDVAHHVSDLCEDVYQRLIPAVGWAPDELTEIILTDDTDSANGSASALPFNAISLYVTAPDDMSPLGDVDDWYLELVTHEYTHILHTDHIRGIPRLINKILGKTIAPNQVQPHWILEGLAVFEESERTSGGRLRSSMWNMWMRADVLEGNVATLDQFSNVPRRWPQGNIWYLYGSFFLKWIADTFGEQAIRAMIDDYAYQVVPYAINRSIRRATGRTYEELYTSWVDSMRRSYGAEADAIRARGVREGVRLTHTGNTYEHPRWIPANSWPDHANDLLFFADDGHSAAGLYAMPLVRDEHGRVLGGREDRREMMIRTDGSTGASFFPDGGVAFSSGEIHNNLYFFDDLFEMPPHEKSPGGLEGQRVRWSDGWRALDPSLSPDGRHVVFTVNHRGTTTLMIADVVPSSELPGRHELANVRTLVQSVRFDQAYTPRWAPDGRHVAYSSWQHGGFRDIRIVDVTDGSFVYVTRDRAIDGDPVYSADGRWLYFHSDRTGVMNVYAWEVATGRLRQVTNAVNGAYQPEPSPDGRSLAYVGYTHEGYDVFVMPLDETQWLEPLPYVETRPAPPREPPPSGAVEARYDPLKTLVPRAYKFGGTAPLFVTQPGNFGQATTISVSGSDIAGWHSIGLTQTIEWEHPELEGAISYGYGRLPFDVGLSAYRSITPATNYSIGGNTQEWIQQSEGISTSIGYARPRAFESQSFSLAYSLASVSGELPYPVSALNPYAIPSIPNRGMLGSMHFGWGYSNAQSYLWSVGAERGFSVSSSFDVADPMLASDFRGYAMSVNLQNYWPMPWAKHHTLALHAGVGMGGGDRGGKGPYYVGGFLDLPLANVIQNQLIQGGIQLRGYPPVVEAGNYIGIFNAEYRFPIVNVDRGLSTLPVFLNRINGNVFIDEGSAFSDPHKAMFLTGVGGELWFDFMLGYVLSFEFRLGYAKGLSTDGIDKVYFVAAVPF
ncbi:MAG TPA: hypothetical protein VF765_10230 [Polyangiaceae bacterium]